MCRQRHKHEVEKSEYLCQRSLLMTLNAHSIIKLILDEEIPITSVVKWKDKSMGPARDGPSGWISREPRGLIFRRLRK